MSSTSSFAGAASRFARRIDTIGTEGAFRVAAEARALETQGRDVVHLEIGEPDFPSPPHVVEAAVRALRDGATKYSPPPGLPPLREAIAAAARARGIAAAAENVVVTSGAKPLLLYAFLALLDPGDEVLVPDIGFPIYPSVARLIGATPRLYPIAAHRGGFRVDVPLLAAAITARTRLIVLNSPHNPTGFVSSPQELRAIADLALERDLWILSDEIYDGLTYELPAAPTLAALPEMPARTIVIDGFSKRYAMTGWRLGYGIMPAALARQVTTLVINSTSCAPAFVQHGALAALAGPQTSVATMRDAFRARRDAFVPALAGIPGVRCAPPAGAFYAFADVRETLSRTGLSTGEFAHRLLHEFGVAAIPGDDFGPGGAGFIRFSFASSLSALERAVERLARCIAALPASNPGKPE